MTNTCAEAPPNGPRLSDFAIAALWLSSAVAIALVQLRHQTLLGRFLLLAGFTVVAVGLGYVMLKEPLFDPWLLTLLEKTNEQELAGGYLDKWE